MAIRFIESRTKKVYETSHCLQGLNLLGHAQLIELEMGSQCGGKGRCGRDRVKFEASPLALVNAPTAVERIHLSEKAIAEGWRLACQVFPNEDGLNLEVYFEAVGLGE